MENYTKIRVVKEKETTMQYISEEELVLLKLCGKYVYIEYLNDNGQLHRLDGPAFEGSSGYKAWYKEGRAHRTDGPAVVWSNGREFWYVNGIEQAQEGGRV